MKGYTFVNLEADFSSVLLFECLWLGLDRHETGVEFLSADSIMLPP